MLLTINYSGMGRMMSKRKFCIFVVLLVFAVVSITPMTTSANTFASAGVAGIGAAFGAAAHIGPVSTADAGSITLSGLGFGYAEAGPGMSVDAFANANTFNAAASFASAICIRGVAGRSTVLGLAFGGVAIGFAGTSGPGC